MMTPRFPSSAFATSASTLRQGDQQHGRGKGGDGLQLSLLIGGELQNLLNSCQRD